MSAAKTKSLPKISNKDLNELVQMAHNQGWRVKQTKNNHVRVFPPNKSLGFITIAISSNNKRVYQNMKAEFKKRGLKGV